MRPSLVRGRAGLGVRRFRASWTGRCAREPASGFDARNPTEVGCERVTRPVHVEAGANAVADEDGLFEHSVPPAMHGGGCASLLRVGPVDAPNGFRFSG